DAEHDVFRVMSLVEVRSPAQADNANMGELAQNQLARVARHASAGHARDRVVRDRNGAFDLFGERRQARTQNKPDARGALGGGHAVSYGKRCGLQPIERGRASIYHTLIASLEDARAPFSENPAQAF